MIVFFTLAKTSTHVYESQLQRPNVNIISTKWPNAAFIRKRLGAKYLKSTKTVHVKTTLRRTLRQ